MYIIPFIGLALLVALSIFQFLLICGAPLGNFAWGGKHKVLPRKLRIGSAVSILLYVIFAIFLLTKAGIATIIPDDQIVTLGMWIFTAYFFIGIVMNLISQSKKERLLMTPAAALLAVVFLLVSLS